LDYYRRGHGGTGRLCAPAPPPGWSAGSGARTAAW